MHRAITVSLSLLVVLSLSGCRTFVGLSSDRYVPRLPETLRRYQGTQLHMPGFENRANDTTLFYYYSPTSSASYGGPVLVSYLWYGFQKALMQLGIRVYEEAPPVPVPEMRLAFLSWTERFFLCEVQLLFPGQQLVKRYQIAFPDPGEDPDRMEQQAYRQVDQIVTHVFGDPDFAEVFMRSQPRWPAQPPASLPPPYLVPPVSVPRTTSPVPPPVSTPPGK